MTPETLALMIFSIAGVLVLYTWHRQSDTFDLRHLVVDSKTDRVSLMKCGQLFALLVSTWVLIRETNNNRLTEWLFGSYMVAWSGVNLVRRYIDVKTKSDDK